jgi:hypothetical protein
VTGGDPIGTSVAHRVRWTIHCAAGIASGGNETTAGTGAGAWNARAAPAFPRCCSPMAQQLSATVCVPSWPSPWQQDMRAIADAVQPLHTAPIDPPASRVMATATAISRAWERQNGIEVIMRGVNERGQVVRVVHVTGRPSRPGLHVLPPAGDCLCG